jgi:O-antigen ligase
VLWKLSGVPQGNYSRIVAVCLLIGWLARGFGSWRFGRARPIVLALIGFWVWAYLSFLQVPTNTEDVAWTLVEEHSKVVLPFLVGMTTITSVKQLKQLSFVILLSQGYIAYEMNLSYLGGYNKIREDGFGGMDNNSVAIAMVSCIGMAFFTGLDSKKWWGKAFGFGIAVLLAHSVLISFSRGGILAMGVTGIIIFMLIPKQPKHYLAFAVAALIVLRLTGPNIWDRMKTLTSDEVNRDFSAQSRLELWADCWDAMKQEPFFGVGPNHWGLIVERYGWPAGKHAHSVWLQTGAELGIPGLLFLLAFYGICVKRLWPIARERIPVADPWMRNSARMVIASLTGYAFAAQFVSLLTLEVPFYIALVGAGLLRLVPDVGTVPNTADGSSPDWSGEAPTSPV